MAHSDDDYDSDDSGFGFDDGLSTDQEMLVRIAKMRGMMNLAKENDTPAPPTVPTVVTNPTIPTVPTLPTPTVHTVPTPPPAATEDDDDEKKTATAETTALDEDEFLLVDRVHTLALSQHREQSLQAARASEDVLSGPRRGAAAEDEDEEGEVGAEDEEEEEEEEEDDGYVVTWARGQLGLLFKAGARGETLIRRINKKTSSAEGLHLARVGDVLVAVNGASVRGRAFQEIVEQLRLPDFPVTLSFQPLKLSDDDDEEEQTVRMSDPREMERKQSSVSAISSASSTNASFSMGNGNPNANGFGAAPAHRLNQLAGSSAPPPYGGGPASLSRSQSLEDPLGPGEYDVVWHHGSLGCGIKQRNGLPTIKSVTPGAAVDESVQQIEQDDVMIRINGMDTEAIGFRAVVEMMRSAPKPLYMRFRRAGQVAFQPPPPVRSHGLPRPSSRYENTDIENLRESRATDDPLDGSLSPNQYTVLWNEGPLGVQIKRRQPDGAVVVTKFTGTGDPELLSAITIGDVFVRIAGVNVADMGITGTYEKLKTVHKPVVLVFERASPHLHPPPPMTYEMPPMAPMSQGPHVPPSQPQAPPPPSAVRQGFSVDDMRDSTVVPSFRELREREAAANQGRYRDSFAGFTPEERGDTAFGATGRRAALALQRPASYDTLDGHSVDQEGLRSRHSFPAADPSGGDARYQDRASDPSADNSGGRGGVGADGSEFLPRFSDIEKGRVKTTTVATLPPPPAYHDTFTPSGRFLDPKQFADAPQPPLSPHSDGRQGSSVSSGQGRPHGAAPSYNQAFGYTQPTPPPAARNPSPYSMPAPPIYDQYAENYPRGNHGGGGGGFGGSNRIDALRQQYIESERQRNQQPPVGARDGAMTEISTYSDLDDSGIMAAMQRPANRMRTQMNPAFGTPQPARQPLPAPELWIQWSEGPLGITFRRTNGQIVVSRLTGAGFSRGLEQLRAGDWLLSIGNRGVGTYPTAELRLAETMELIKRQPKPVDMRFILR